MSRADLIPFATLLLRIALGVLFLAHGLLKLLVFKPAGTAAYFRSLGLPGVVGYLTMAAEIGGGTLLVLGIATSLVTIGLVPLVLGTIVMVRCRNVAQHSGCDKALQFKSSDYRMPSATELAVAASGKTDHRARSSF